MYFQHSKVQRWMYHGDSKWQLGVVISSNDFNQEHVKEKINEWTSNP